uniref:Uncharacterized protein n=1 Tax=Vitis vinifera TaxID=29760 RepID=F6H830_VITVI
MSEMPSASATFTSPSPPIPLSPPICGPSPSTLTSLAPTPPSRLPASSTPTSPT